MSLKVSDISKRFGSDDRPVEVLRSISFEMAGGQSLVIMGPSGSGKSTLLHVIGTLDRPSSGHLEINGEDPFVLPEPELARFRNRVIGFVFQDHHLLPQYSVLENVLVPTLAFKGSNGDAKARALELIERVGLSHRIDHRPAELSGGERQRVGGGAGADQPPRPCCFVMSPPAASTVPGPTRSPPSSSICTRPNRTS